MNKLRKALLEMFFIGIAIGIVACATGRNIDIIAGLLIGLLFSPIVWAVYRLGRFMFFPASSSGWREPNRR